MKIITEADLRSALIKDCETSFEVPKGSYLTPTAREYLTSRGIELLFVDTPQKMPRQVIKKSGKYTFIDYETGKGYETKPEEMTHLYGNVLVPKTSARILFRGKLDSLEADIICLQLLCDEEGNHELTASLEEVLFFVRQILACEVKNEEFPLKTLFGLSESDLREISHHIKAEFGIDHPVPNYRMGKIAVSLNYLRTRVRETELAAAKAFEGENDKREDIIRALNRLSSGVYILLCKFLSQKQKL